MEPKRCRNCKEIIPVPVARFSINNVDIYICSGCYGEHGTPAVKTKRVESSDIQYHGGKFQKC